MKYNTHLSLAIDRAVLAREEKRTAWRLWWCNFLMWLAGL